MRRIVMFTMIMLSLFNVCCKSSFEEVVCVNSEEEPILTKDDTLKVMATAFAMQESKCTEKAVSSCGKYVGCLQISKIMTREANRLQKEKKYTYDDRYDKQLSLEIFSIIMKYHNEQLDINRAIDIWNRNCPDTYRDNVIENYNRLLQEFTTENYFAL